MRRTRIAMLLLLGMALPAPISAAEIKGQRDVAYGHNQAQKLDVFVPPACPPVGCPVIVAVHGGGWTGGDKADYERAGVSVSWARQGYVVASINYRLAPAFPHPAQSQDVALAVRWLKDNISAYRGNPSQIILLGHSSGGHLVSLVGVDSSYMQAVGLDNAKDLAAVVSVDTDSLDLLQRRNLAGDQDVSRMLTFTPENEQAASPLWQVQDQRSYPPFLLIAASDARLGRQQVSQMAEKLNGVGGQAQAAVIDYWLPLNTHIRILNDLADPSSQVARRVRAFLQSQGLSGQ